MNSCAKHRVPHPPITIFVMTYSLWGWRLLTAIAPDLFGHPCRRKLLGLRRLLGRRDLSRHHAAHVCNLRAHHRAPQQKTHLGDIVFLFALLIISVELALGGNTPIFPLFYRYIPGFNFFQAPARMLIGYTFAVSLLAGIGADQWKESRSQTLLVTPRRCRKFRHDDLGNRGCGDSH